MDRVPNQGGELGRHEAQLCEGTEYGRGVNHRVARGRAAQTARAALNAVATAGTALVGNVDDRRVRIPIHRFSPTYGGDLS